MAAVYTWAPKKVHEYYRFSVPLTELQLPPHHLQLPFLLSGPSQCLSSHTLVQPSQTAPGLPSDAGGRCLQGSIYQSPLCETGIYVVAPSCPREDFHMLRVCSKLIALITHLLLFPCPGDVLTSRGKVDLSAWNLQWSCLLLGEIGWSRRHLATERSYLLLLSLQSW